MTEAGDALPEREGMDFDVVIVGAGPAGTRRRDQAPPVGG